MTTLESVRAKVVKAVPEIMGVKVGCVLNLHAGESYGWMTVHQMTSVCKKHKKYREECGLEENGCSAEEAVFGTSGNDDCEWWMHTVKIADIKPYEIVGRPITLADVLRAIFGSDKMLYVRGDGEMYKVLHGNLVPGFHKWNLSLPLDDQSPEVLEFLEKILTN